MGQVDLSNYFILILSAGFGKRMKFLGKNTPKALLKKNNKTFIHHIISKCKEKSLKNICFVLGYKSNLIIEELKKLNLNFKYIYNNKYKNTGSIFSWYLSKNIWEKNKKKKFLLLHADIFFDSRFLKSILESDKKNIIGIKKFDEINYKKKNLYVCSDKNNTIKDIGYGKDLIKSQITGQILCINKLSRRMTDDFFKYCKKSFHKNKKSKNLTWEILMNNFIKDENKKFYTISNQNYFWFNVNTQTDYNKLKEFKLNE